MEKLENETFPNSVTIIRAIVNITLSMMGITTITALCFRIYIYGQNYELLAVLPFVIVFFVVIFLAELKTYKLIKKDK